MTSWSSPARARAHQLVWALLCLVVMSLIASSARAQRSSGVFEYTEPNLADAAYLGITVPIAGALMFAPAPGNDLFGPTDFDLAIATDLAWEDNTLALKMADWLLLSMGTAAVVSPFLFNWSVDDSDVAGALVGVEAMASASLLSGILKTLTGRRRPSGDTFDSFFSGHTAVTFAAATIVTAFAYEYEWLDDGTRWVIPATSYSMAAFTGYLRLAGGQHWLTDVLVGAVVGTSVSYLTFAVRTGG